MVRSEDTEKEPELSKTHLQDISLELKSSNEHWKKTLRSILKSESNEFKEAITNQTPLFNFSFQGIYMLAPFETIESVDNTTPQG